MRKLILKMSMTIDGFVAGPNGELDWLFRTSDEAGRAWTVERIWQAGVHAMGAKTFRDMAAFWPTSQQVFAAPMNEIPKVVFSRRGPGTGGGATTRGLQDARVHEPAAAGPGHTESWDSARWMVGDLAEQVARLKAEDGKPILAHGGAELARSLVALDLVDEYWLLVHPVALGRGLALFGALGAPRDFRLAEVKAFPGGAIAHGYTRA